MSFVAGDSEELLAVPRTVNDSEGIEPTALFDAIDGPEFSSSKPDRRFSGL